MANTDQNITELPIKTASEVLDADYMLGIDLVEGYQVSTKDFADYAVNRAAISIGGRTQTTASAISEVRTTAGNAQPKESGKGLSANDFTNAYKSKLDGIAAGAEVNVQSDWNASSGDAAILHKPTTISGYGITDAYTKTQMDTSLAAKSDKATTYTKSDVDAIVNTDDDTSDAGNPITIETDAAQYAKATHLTLAPVQDLHGYDHPWAGGAGKNLLPNNVTDETVVLNGVTLTKKNGVYSISGTATADTEFSIPLEASVDLNPSANKICFLNTKAQTSGFVSLYFFRNNDTVHYWGMSEVNRVASGWSDTGNEVINKIVISVTSGTVVASGMVISPMLLPLTESNPTSFAPYSNICPITPMGHRNLLVPQSIANPFVSNGITFIVNADGSVTVNGTASSNTWLLIGTAHLTAGKKYILTGGIDAGRMMQLTDYPVVNSKGFDSGSSGLIFTAETNVVYGVRAYIASGVTVNNETLYPMLRPASDLDSTFVPYGMARVGAKVTGKNLLNRNTTYTNTANNVTFTLDGLHMEATGTANGSNTDTARYVFSPITLFKDNTYTFSLNGVASGSATANMRLFIDTTSIMWLGTASLTDGMYVFTITPTEDILFNGIAIRFYTSSGTVMNIDGYLQLELGSTATAYEPYQGYTASLDLPEEVYGGTLNLETGELVIDRGSVKVSPSWSWTKSSNFSGGFYVNIWEIRTGQKLDTPFICSHAKTATSIVQYNKGTCFCDGSINIRIMDDSDTVQDWKDYINAQSTAGTPIQICYELATPQIYQLTPAQLALFKGINNVSTNAKTVQVTYRNGELATTGDIVDAVEVAKQNAIGESASYTDARLATELAPILGNLASAETSPASASHAVGEYLLYNGNLYKVLASISVGQQLTIGTNIGQTNVAAELASQAIAISVLNGKIVNVPSIFSKGGQSFANGVATIDITSEMASIEKTSYSVAVASIETGGANNIVVRGCDKVSNTSVKVVLNDNTYTGTVNLIIMVK